MWQELRETGIYWLKFEGFARRFYTENGRPSTNEISKNANGFFEKFKIKLQALDIADAKATTTFYLTVINRKPIKNFLLQE